MINKKKFETIHGIIGQSIRDKECLIKYKKENNNHLQKNNISFHIYTNGKKKILFVIGIIKNKNNHNIQKE